MKNPPLGTSIHALAVMAASGVRPIHGQHIRDTMAAHAGTAGPMDFRLHVETQKHGDVVICPHAKANYKEWNEDRWAGVIDALSAWRHVRVCGMPGRRFLGRLCGPMSIEALAFVLAGASLVIAVDSGPVHLAEALGVPVVGLYAATSSVTYGPYMNRERCVDRHREASDALGLAYDSSRHLTEGNAMDLITVDDVLEACRG